MLDRDRAMVSWMEGSKIKARIVNKDGTMGTPLEVANSSSTRSSGFPQMTKTGEKLIFAWTDDEKKNIQTLEITDW